MQGVGVFCGARARTLYRRSDFPFRQRQPSTHSPLRGARGTWTHTVRKTHTAHTSRLEWRRCSWRPCEQRGSAQRGHVQYLSAPLQLRLASHCGLHSDAPQHVRAPRRGTKETGE